MTDENLKTLEKGAFSLNHDRWKKGGMRETNNSMYDCAKCLEKGKKHKIIEKPGPSCKNSHAHAIKGEPTTIRVCTGCGTYDGPWVPG